MCHIGGCWIQLESSVCLHIPMKKETAKTVKTLTSVSRGLASVFQIPQCIQPFISSSPSSLKPCDGAWRESVVFLCCFSTLFWQHICIHLCTSRGWSSLLNLETFSYFIPHWLVCVKAFIFSEDGQWDLEIPVSCCLCFRCMRTTYLWSTNRGSTNSHSYTTHAHTHVCIW